MQKLDDLRAGKGEFDTEAAFYAYWRKYSFNIGRAVQQQLDKLLKSESAVVAEWDRHDANCTEV